MQTQVRTRIQIDDRLRRVNDVLYIMLVGYGIWVALWLGIGRLIIHYHDQAVLAGTEPTSLSDTAIMAIFFAIGAFSGAGAVWTPLRDFLVEKKLLVACITLMNKEDNLRNRMRQNSS